MLNQTTLNNAALTQPVYTDRQDIAQMRQQARQDPRAALEQVARQFEGLFLQMMLKSMRDASFGDSIFDSSQGELYRDMYDKQITLNMTQHKGLGLADAMLRQLGKYLPPAASDKAPAESLPVMTKPVARASEAAPIYTAHDAHSAPLNAASMPRQSVQFESPEEFVTTLWPLAEKAAAQLNTQPEFLLAQAALETGWGKYMTRFANGESSHNLFNIKADSRWQGASVNKPTLEFHAGVPRLEQARFRAYDSYADSFADYVRFLKNQGRYAEALQRAGEPEVFARSLQDAGYATDPDYADKIIDIMQRNVRPATASLTDDGRGDKPEQVG